MLLISIMLQLKICLTDFSNALVQADLKEEPVYISPPPMMGNFPRDTVLKLNKSFYGQADAPRMWYDKLSWFRDSKDIDAVFKSFKEDGDKYNWEMTKGGSVEDFISIKVNSLDDGT
eukprot:6175998-Ditylum_brightwellii.AAC.1